MEYEDSFSQTAHKDLYVESYRESLPQFKATMPPHKWVDNAELSVPDQMTNITEKTRPQSCFQLSGWRPNTQDQFNSTHWLLRLASECVGLLNVAQASKKMAMQM